MCFVHGDRFLYVSCPQPNCYRIPNQIIFSRKAGHNCPVFHLPAILERYIVHGNCGRSPRLNWLNAPTPSCRMQLGVNIPQSPPILGIAATPDEHELCPDISNEHLRQSCCVSSSAHHQIKFGTAGCELRQSRGDYTRHKVAQERSQPIDFTTGCDGVNIGTPEQIRTADLWFRKPVNLCIYCCRIYT